MLGVISSCQGRTLCYTGGSDGSEHLSGIDIRECGKDPLTGEHISHNPSSLRAEYERATAQRLNLRID